MKPLATTDFASWLGLRRKASKATPTASTTKRLKAKSVDLSKDDESVESEDDNYLTKDSSEDEEDEETVDAKRVRMARDYLQRLEAAPGESSSEEGDDNDEEPMNMRDRVTMRLQRERLKREGNLERNIADYVARDVTWMYQENLKTSEVAPNSTLSLAQEAKRWIDSGRVQLFRGHELTPTSVALQESGERAISGAKDHSVILWDMEHQKKLAYIVNPWKKGEQRGDGEALCVATSDDGRYAAVGRRDATVNIFDVRVSSSTGASKNSLITSFHGHKGPVTCLAFRTQSNQLFSGSEDRCIRHYNLDEMTYVETLYGHQAGVSAIDCHRGERPISVGRDRTARGWKLAEDTHLIFRGGSKVSSADCISCVKDDWFVSGHDDGHLCMWLTDKKKSVVTIPTAHGDDGKIGRGIVSVASLKGSDMVASGSNDGYLRLWKLTTGDTVKSRGMEAMTQIPLHGFINAIAIGPKAKFAVVAVGQEHRLGRWDRVSKAKNRFGIVDLRRRDQVDDDDDDDDDVVQDDKAPSTVGNHRSDVDGDESE